MYTQKQINETMCVEVSETTFLKINNLLKRFFLCHILLGHVYNIVKTSVIEPLRRE